MMRPKNLELPTFMNELLVKCGINLLPGNKYVVSDSVKMKNQSFKSVKSNVTNSIDHFIELQNGEIGSVHKYIQSHNEVYLLLRKYDVYAHEQVHHLIKIKPTEQYKVCLCSDIHCKLLYLKLGFLELVTKEPNFFEIN